MKIRKRRGLSQVEFAQKIGSTQRAISYYEVVAEFPPAEVVVQLPQALRVTADELLGISEIKDPQDARSSRLWRKLRQIEKLPPLRPPGSPQDAGRAAGTAPGVKALEGPARARLAPSLQMAEGFCGPERINGICRTAT